MRTSAGVIVSLLLLAAPLRAQMTGAPLPGYRREVTTPASAIPAPLREIGFEQRLDQPLPLDTRFTDDEGHEVAIGSYFGTRPVVLGFVYFDCPMLCGQIVSALTAALRTMSLDAGRDFEVVLVSFDPRETPALAAAKKADALRRYDRADSAAGWHFLTGQAASIERLTRAAGFRYAWDEQTQQFAHPAGLIVVTPDGRPARYLFGLEYGPRDVRLALVEASAGKVGSPVDSILLYCYHYDPMTGRYGFLVMRAVRLAGAATVLALGGFILIMVRRERRGAIRPAGSTPLHPRTSHPS